MRDDFTKRPHLRHIPIRTKVGVLIISVVVLGSALAPLISPYGPTKPDYRNLYSPPSAAHPLGTDDLGRDVLSRVLYGGRMSLAVAVGASGIALAAGGILGSLSAFRGGWIDRALVHLSDALLAFPGLLLALLVVAILGGGAWQTIGALGFAGTPIYFRLARSYAQRMTSESFVEAARALGMTDRRILMKHIIPNFVGPLLVQSATTTATFLLVEASLSYLGLGISPPTPTWGSILQSARLFLTRQPWAAVAPGAALGTATLGFQLLSDGLRDLLDPRFRGRVQLTLRSSPKAR
ncbi:MAG: ABC transporter permease [bacterium]